MVEFQFEIALFIFTNCYSIAWKCPKMIRFDLKNFETLKTSKNQLEIELAGSMPNKITFWTQSFLLFVTLRQPLPEMMPVYTEREGKERESKKLCSLWFELFDFFVCTGS